jgi:hypothetical protein
VCVCVTQHSLNQYHIINVTQHEQCQVSLTVLGTTNSNGHQWKLVHVLARIEEKMVRTCMARHMGSQACGRSQRCVPLATRSCGVTVLSRWCRCGVTATQLPADKITLRSIRRLEEIASLAPGTTDMTYAQGYNQHALLSGLETLHCS